MGDLFDNGPHTPESAAAAREEFARIMAHIAALNLRVLPPPALRDDDWSAMLGMGALRLSKADPTQL